MRVGSRILCHEVAVVSFRNYIQLPHSYTALQLYSYSVIQLPHSYSSPYSEMLEFALAFTAGDIGRTDKLLFELMHDKYSLSSY